ncbi:MAG: flagellar motor protein MotB [Oligoflexia bacterium]|jgi:chemotaxis protein MotB
MAEAPVIVIKKKKGGGHGGHHGGAWKVAYADFVTAMMCFFMVMWLLGADEETKAAIAHYFNHPNTPYTMGRDPQSDEARPLGERQGSGENIMQGLDGQTPDELVEKPMRPVEQQRMAHQELGDLAQEVMEDQLYGLDVSLDTLRFSVPEELLFNPGQTDLKPGSEKYLARLGKILGAYQGYVRIEGHTDDQPESGSKIGSQFEFSLTRAVQVMKFLVQKDFVQEERMIPVGSGARKPFSGGETATARKKNRRIEFTLSSERNL